MRKLTLFALAFALTSIPAVHADGTPAKKPASKESSSPFDHWFGITGFAGVSHTKVKTTQEPLRRVNGAPAGQLAHLDNPKTHVDRSMRSGFLLSLMRNIMIDRLYAGADIGVEFSSVHTRHATRGTNANLLTVNEVATRIKSRPNYRVRLLFGYSFLNNGLVYFGAGLSRDSYRISSQRTEYTNAEHGIDRVVKRKIAQIYSLGYKHLLGEYGHTLGVELNYKPSYTLNIDHQYIASAATRFDKMGANYKISEFSALVSFTYKIF